MSSRQKANIVATVAKRQRFVNLWRVLEKGDAVSASSEVRCFSTRPNSSRHYDENAVSKRNRISPRPLNGHSKINSRRKRDVVSPVKQGEEPAGSTLQVSREDDKSKTEAQDLLERDSQSTHTSPSELAYTGDTLFPVTSRLHIVTPDEDTPRGTWPIFRMMDEDGTFRDGTNDGYQNEEEAISNYSVLNSTVNRTKINGGADCESILSEFRASLCEKYPNQVSEIERSGLLLPSKSVFPDTDSNNTLERLLRHMLRLRQMDSIFNDAQRQGRISFYLTCTGEEGIHFGATSALENQDIIFGQYREQGPIMWRGFTLQQFADQCFSNASDLGKGRQMPIHYGSRALNYQTISSPLGTQIPQAVGVALHFKKAAAAAAKAGDSQHKKGVSICFFGDGATSTTDFHSGLNFAATLKCPVIFFCRNNGYAISTSVKEQYAGDGIVSRAPGYGMAGIRVDGNDVFAVHAAVREARAYAVENNAPVLIEAMCYRQGHHSTSDDSSQYRSSEEVDHFVKTSDPLDRLKKFFKVHQYGDVTDETIQSILQEEKKAILEALRTAEKKPKPPVEDLFTDVYKDMTPSLQSQWTRLREHMEKYPDDYKM